MTTTDFSIEFDLLYNNALSNSAPELNLYEKSLFLTQAQEEIVKEAYSNKKTGTFFEGTEAIRRRLDELSIMKVSAYDGTLNAQLSSLKISNNSKFFKIEDDVWYITYDRINTSASQLYIIPVALDQYSLLEGNPFKEPNTKKAWRLNIKNTVNANNVVEIVTTQTPTSYVYRYLKEPSPIVLVDLSVEYPDQGLSINGVTAETNCDLNSEAHRVILKRAVELATMAYKENTLGNNIQLNNRNN